MMLFFSETLARSADISADGELCCRFEQGRAQYQPDNSKTVLSLMDRDNNDLLK